MRYGRMTVAVVGALVVGLVAAAGPASAQPAGADLVTVPANTWLYAARSKRADRAKAKTPLVFRVVKRRGAWLEVESLLSGDVPNYCDDPRSELSQNRLRLFVPRRSATPTPSLPAATCKSRRGEKPVMKLVWPNGRVAGAVHHRDAILTDPKGKLRCFDVSIGGSALGKDGRFDVCVTEREFMQYTIIRTMASGRGSVADTADPGGGSLGTNADVRDSGPTHAAGGAAAQPASTGPWKGPLARPGDRRRAAALLRFLPVAVDGRRAASRAVADDFLVHAAYPIPRGDMLNINISFVRNLAYAQGEVEHAALRTRKRGRRGGYKVGVDLSGRRAALSVKSGPLHQPAAELKMLIDKRVLVSVSIQVDDPTLLRRYARNLDIAGIAVAAKSAGLRKRKR